MFNGNTQFFSSLALRSVAMEDGSQIAFNSLMDRLQLGSSRQA